MDSTAVIAWWGAIVASFVFLWDIIKWLQSGPRIRKIITLNVHYDDGKVLSTEKKESGNVTTYEQYCHVEVINIGSIPTTIMGISATHKENKNGGQLTSTSQAFTPHYGKNFLMF